MDIRLVITGLLIVPLFGCATYPTPDAPNFVSPEWFDRDYLDRTISADLPKDIFLPVYGSDCTRGSYHANKQQVDLVIGCRFENIFGVGFNFYGGEGRKLIFIERSFRQSVPLTPEEARDFFDPHNFGVIVFGRRESRDGLFYMQVRKAYIYDRRSLRILK